MDDTNQKTKFQQVLEILDEKGWSKEKITELTTELAKASFNKFYSEAVINFTDEDLDAIETCSNEEAEAKIKELYKMRTGKDADEEAAKFYDIFADGFLEEHAKNPND